MSNFQLSIAVGAGGSCALAVAVAVPLFPPVVNKYIVTIHGQMTNMTIAQSVKQCIALRERWDCPAWSCSRCDSLSWKPALSCAHCDPWAHLYRLCHSTSKLYGQQLLGPTCPTLVHFCSCNGCFVWFGQFSPPILTYIIPNPTLPVWRSQQYGRNVTLVAKSLLAASEPKVFPWMIVSIPMTPSTSNVLCKISL